MLPAPPHTHAWLDPFAGDDKYDIQFGTGVCTDVHYDYMHSGCDSLQSSRVMMAIVSCPPKAYMKGAFMCGILVDIDEDYVHSVGISAISLIYPRTLVEEAQVNGITQQRITCWTPTDCQDKCDHMARTAHSGGLPAPPACALCSPPCPNNVAETIFTAFRALGIDIMSAIRLAALCLNPVACVCQVRHAQTQTISLLGTRPCHATGQHGFNCNNTSSGGNSVCAFWLSNVHCANMFARLKQRRSSAALEGS